MNEVYVCPVCGREYVTPLPLSPGFPTCSGSRSGGKHSTREMKQKQTAS